MENNQERIQETLKRSQTVRHDHLFKVVVLGDAKVGKTSLVAAFTGDSFSDFILLIFTQNIRSALIKYVGPYINLK